MELILIDKLPNQEFRFHLKGYYLNNSDILEGINIANKIIFLLNTRGYYACLDWEYEGLIFQEQKLIYPLMIRVSNNPINPEPDILNFLKLIKTRTVRHLLYSSLRRVKGIIRLNKFKKYENRTINSHNSTP